MNLSIYKTGHGLCELGHIGNVSDVIHANIPKEVTAKRYNAKDFKMAFEIATPKTVASLGDTVIVNGYCYTTSTDVTSLDYGRTISGHEFITGGVFLIPLNALPSIE